MLGRVAAMEAAFKPSRVLVLSKTTRWEVLANKRGRNNDMNRFLREKHELQSKYVDEVCAQLKKHNVEVTVVKTSAYDAETAKNADLIISAGGDGTFLSAASLVRDQTPVIGINTDPIGSEGHLSLTGKEERKVGDVIDRFFGGNFRFFPRQRVRVSFIDSASAASPPSSQNHECLREVSDHARLGSEDEQFPHRQEIVLPLLALNEVFVGESHAARVSYLEIQFDDGPVYKQKNSGIIVCTGTGSTSWHYNVNRLTEQSFTDILAKLRELGYQVEPPLNADAVAELCKRYNERLLFSPDERKMMYSMRDPVFNCTYAKIPPRGVAKRIRIKSKCSHAHLTLDSATSIPFNHGSEVIIELHPEDALRTAILL